tara:strand:- start:908 stop:1669 length:762 start_codon:yes stop_codon:yes gene_type:complete
VLDKYRNMWYNTSRKKNKVRRKPMNNNLPEGFHYVDEDEKEYDTEVENTVMNNNGNGSVAVDDPDQYVTDANNVDEALGSWETTTKPLFKAPTKHDNYNDSRNRIKFLKEMVGHKVPDDFDPHEISWVLPNLGVTGAEGAENAIKKGYFSINVAGELSKTLDATVNMPIEPNVWGYSSSPDVLSTLESIVNTMEMAMATEQKVVVNCSMGMERSVLATVWYLVRNKSMSLDNAYDFVRSVRPIATDRREWIVA